MATALQKQLEALRQRPEHERQLLKSFLFSSADSIQFSREQIHELAVSGVRDLVLVDSRFDAIAKQLLDPAHIRRERARLVDAEAEQLNQVIDRAFVLLSPHLHLQCSHRFLEYLIRVHEVHEYNVASLLAAFLPYHDQGLFVRAIALCDLRGTGFEFLKDNQLKGAALPRSQLLIGCLENPKVLRAVCGAATKAIDAGVVNHPACSLWIAIATALANRGSDLVTKAAGGSGAGDAAFRILLPIIVDWLAHSYEPTPSRAVDGGGAAVALAQNAAIASNAALVVLAAWGAEVSFSADVLVLLGNALVRCLQGGRCAGGPTYKQFAQVLALLFETQPGVNDASFAPVMRSIVALSWPTYAPDVSLFAAAASPNLVTNVIAHAIAARATNNGSSLAVVAHWSEVVEKFRERDIDLIVSAALEDFLVADRSGSGSGSGKKAAAPVSEALLSVFHTVQRRFAKSFDKVVVAAIERARSLRAADGDSVTNAIYRFVSTYLGGGGKYELVQLDANAFGAAADSDDDTAATATPRAATSLMPLISCLLHPIPTVRKVALERSLKASQPSPAVAEIVASALLSEANAPLALQQIRLLKHCFTDKKNRADYATALADACEALYHVAVVATVADAVQPAYQLLQQWAEEGEGVARLHLAACAAWGVKGKKSAGAIDAVAAPGAHASAAFWTAALQFTATQVISVPRDTITAALDAMNVKFRRFAAAGKRGAGAAQQPLTATDVASAIRLAIVLTCSNAPGSVPLLMGLARNSPNDDLALPFTAAAIALCVRLGDDAVASDIAAFTVLPTLSLAARVISDPSFSPTKRFVTWSCEAIAIQAARYNADDAVSAARTVAAVASIASKVDLDVAAVLLCMPPLAVMTQVGRRAVLDLATAAAGSSPLLIAALEFAAGNSIGVDAVKPSAADVVGFVKRVFSEKRPSVLWARAIAFGRSLGASRAVIDVVGPQVLALVRGAQQQPLRKANLAQQDEAVTPLQRAGELTLAEYARVVVDGRASEQALALLELTHCAATSVPTVLPGDAVLECIAHSADSAVTLFPTLSSDTALSRRLAIALAILHRRGVAAASRAAAVVAESLMPHLVQWADELAAGTSTTGAAAANSAVEQVASSGDRKAGKKTKPASSTEKTGRPSAALQQGDDAEALFVAAGAAAGVVIDDVAHFAVQTVQRWETASTSAVHTDSIAASIGRIAIALSRVIQHRHDATATNPEAASDRDAADLAVLVQLTTDAVRCAGRASHSIAIATLNAHFFAKPWMRTVASLVSHADSVAISAAAIALSTATIQAASKSPCVDVIVAVSDAIVAAKEQAGAEAASKLLASLLPMLSRGASAAVVGSNGAIVHNGADDDDDDDVPTIFVAKGAKGKAAVPAKYNAKGTGAAASTQQQAGALEVTAEDRAASLKVLHFAILALLLRLSTVATTAGEFKFQSPRDVVLALLLALSTHDRLICIAGIANVLAQGALHPEASLTALLPASCPAELKTLLGASSKATLQELIPTILASLDDVTQHDRFVREFVRDNSMASVTSTSRSGMRARAKELSRALYRGGRHGATIATTEIVPEGGEDGTAPDEQNPFFGVVVAFLELYAAAHGTAHATPAAALLGRLITMVDEPTFLMCVRGLITVPDTAASENNASSAAYQPRMIRLRGYEILFDRLAVTNDRRSNPTLASLEHRATAQLGGAVELTPLAAALLADLDTAFRARYSTKEAKQAPLQRPSDDDLEELQWIMVTLEELVKLLGPRAATARSAPALMSIVSAMPKLVMHLCSGSTGIRPAASAVATNDEDDEESPQPKEEGATEDKLTTPLTQTQAVVAATALTALGSIGGVLGFTGIVERATSMLCAALTALRYATHGQVIECPEAALLIPLRRRAVASLAAMLPAVWTMIDPWLPAVFDLCSRRVVVEQDSGCAADASGLIKQMGTLIEPRVLMPALARAVGAAAPVTHSFGMLFSLATAVIERLSRQEVKGMPELIEGTLFTAAAEALARQSQLASMVTLGPIYTAFATLFIKFKEHTCIALLDRLVAWMMKKRPSDAGIGRRDVHRWTIALGLLLHVTKHLGSVGTFMYASLTPSIVEIFVGFADDKTAAAAAAVVDGAGSRKSARAEGNDVAALDRHRDSTGGSKEAIKPLVTAALDIAIDLVRAMSDSVVTATTDLVGDATVAPADLVPYFARPQVFQSFLPALVHLLSNTKYLADEHSTYAERCEASLIPAIRRWFIALRSPKLWSRAQQQLVTLLRHRESKVRRAVLATMRGIYEDGGQELASIIMAEALPQFIEATEDSSDAVVEEARLLCQELSKVTGQDVLHAMTA